MEEEEEEAMQGLHTQAGLYLENYFQYYTYILS